MFNTVVVGIREVLDSLEIWLVVVIVPVVVSEEPCLPVDPEVVFTVVDSGSILFSVLIVFSCVVGVAVVIGELESVVD